MEEKRSIFSPDTKFARFMNVLADVLVTGILWLICCIPIVTVAASTTAAYYAMSKCARHSAGRVVREYFHSFKDNIRQTILPDIVFVAAMGLVAIDELYLWNNRSTINDGLFIALILVCFVIAGIFMYYCPLLSRFSDTNINILKMASILTFRYLPLTIGGLFLFALSVAGVYLMPWAILIIPGVFMYICTFPMEKILHKISPEKEDIVDKDEKSWYNT